MENSSDQPTKNTASKNKYGILSGLFVYIIVGLIGLGLLRTGWPAYAIASRDKSYTLEMLLSRLLTGILASVLAGMITTKTSNDKGENAWFVGVIIFVVASYIHFFR